MSFARLFAWEDDGLDAAGLPDTGKSLIIMRNVIRNYIAGLGDAQIVMTAKYVALRWHQVQRLN